MGIDVGYDLYPPLREEDRKTWIDFLKAVMDRFDGDPVVRIEADAIVFAAGEHPTLDFSIRRFRRFSSKVSGRSDPEWYLHQVGSLMREFFPGRVKAWSDYVETYGPYTWAQVNDAHRKETSEEDYFLVTRGPPVSVAKISTGCWKALKSFEATHVGMDGLVFSSARFPVGDGFHIVQREHGGLLRSVRSLKDWCLDEKDMSKPETQKAYWAARCNNNCQTINRVLLTILKQLKVDLLVHGSTCLRPETLAVCTVGITPKHVGTLVEPPFTSKIPASPDGETFHTFLTAQTRDEEKPQIMAIDASCSQFGAFDDYKRNDPFVVQDLVAYLKRLGKHRTLKRHEHDERATLDYIQPKIEACLGALDDE